MKRVLLLFIGVVLIVISSCTKDSNTFTGTVLHGQPNYYDSMILNTSTYSILYQGNIYTYIPTSPATSNYYTLAISYNGTIVTDASYTYNSYISLNINNVGLFQSSLYVGK